MSEQIRYEYVGDTSSLRSATSDAEKLLSSFASAAQKTFQTFAGLKIADVFANALDESINYIENLNLFNVAMGNSIEVGREFVGTMQELYGMDPSNLMAYAGNFYQLTSAVGATTEASEMMSLQLTKASNDIASLFNVDIETVANNMSSGLRGMTRAVVKYGMDIRATTLQEEAAALGISTKVAKMSEADREGLRYITMMKQASNVMGDFAATIESPANQLRILKEQFSQLSRAIGNITLPLLQKILPYINGFVMALRTAITYLGALLGFKDMDFEDSVRGTRDESDALTALGNSASNASKKVKKLIAPFDELNVLQDQSDSSSGAGASLEDTMNPKIIEAIEALQVGFEDIEMKANRVRDSILQFFGFSEVDGQLKFVRQSFEDNLINKFPGWTQTIQASFDSWDGIVQGFRNVWDSCCKVVSELINDIKEKIKNFFGGDEADNRMAQHISEIPDKLQGIADWIDTHSSGIVKFIEIFAGFKIAGGLISGATNKIQGMSSSFKTLKDGAKIFNQKTGIFAGIKGAVDKFKDMPASGGILGQLFAGAPQAASAMSALISPLGKILLIVGAIAALFAAAFASSPEFRDSVSQTITSLFTILQELWDDCLKPLFDTLGPILKDLWETTILPILKAAMALISSVMELISQILPPILAVLVPIAGFLMQLVIIPIKGVVQVIGAVMETIVRVIQKVIQIIVDLANGDWKAAWEDFKDIFKYILLGLYKIGYAIINNIWGLIKGFVNGIISMADNVAKLFGGAGISYRVTASLQTPESFASQLGLATGGVVTKPTRATIGEGKYDEAVIPLGNSPQMAELVDKIASATNNHGPMEVKVQIGDSEWDAFTYKSAQRGATMVGATPLGGMIRV